MPTNPAPLVMMAEATRRRQRKQRLRRLLLGIAFGFPLFFLVCALLLKFRLKPPPPPAVPVVTPQQAQQAENHMEVITNALVNPNASNMPAAPNAASPVTSAPGPAGNKIVTLRLSEADLNTLLAVNPRIRRTLAQRGVSAVQVILDEPDNITVRAAVLYKGHPANIQVEGTLAPDPDTALHFTATRAQVGRLPAPPALVTAQADKVAAQFTAQVHGRLPLTVQKVEIKNKMLILTGIAAKRTASSVSH